MYAILSAIVAFLAVKFLPMYAAIGLGCVWLGYTLWRMFARTPEAPRTTQEPPETHG